jgi:hypothetical protein
MGTGKLQDKKKKIDAWERLWFTGKQMQATDHIHPLLCLPKTCVIG